MEQDDFKATELDKMTGSYSLQMLKAALSYFPASPRRFLSLFIKMQELKNTLNLFSSPDALSICSAGHQGGFFEALSDIKNYGSPEQRRTFERLETIIQLSSLYEQSQSKSNPAAAKPDDRIVSFEKDEELSAASLNPPQDFREYIRNSLPPESQALFDSYSTLFRNPGNKTGKESDDNDLL